MVLYDTEGHFQTYWTFFPNERFQNGSHKNTFLEHLLDFINIMPTLYFLISSKVTFNGNKEVKLCLVQFELKRPRILS